MNNDVTDMTEREKMLAGLPYANTDPELQFLNGRAKDLIRIYNSLPAGDKAAKTELLSQLLGSCGKNLRIHQPFYVDYGKHIEIGHNSFINLNCTFLDTGRITIGNYVLIGPNVQIYTATHPQYGPERFHRHTDGTVSITTMTAPVTIGDYTWIGGGAILLPGVSIGRNVIIGAGSVVTKSIPDNVTACGTPCVIKGYNHPRHTG